MKNLILLLLSFCFLVSLYGQESATSSVDWSSDVYQKGTKYPGYIITNDGEKIKGFIKAGKRCPVAGLGSSNQNLCEFYTNETDKKPTKKYKPGDIKGYMVAEKIYESILYSGGLFKKPNFNVVATDGAIRIYEWYSKESKSSNYETKIIIAKDPKAPIEHSMLGLKFKKKMAELVADNKEMATKVANKEKGYKMFSMFKIIDEYNNWAKTNK